MNILTLEITVFHYAADHTKDSELDCIRIKVAQRSAYYRNMSQSPCCLLVIVLPEPLRGEE